jgi:flagellar biosynthetic protein FliQ
MSQTTTLAVLQQTLWAVIQLCAPILTTALVVGLIISLIQAVTQINEQAISFVPKTMAVALILVIAGPWMLQTLIEFTSRLYSSIPQLIR